MLFIGGVQIWVSPTWDIEAHSLSTQRFDISMVSFYVGPSRASTTMSFNSQRAIPSQVTNNALTYAHAFEHIAPPTLALSWCR
jgi:hypothetical protein